MDLKIKGQILGAILPGEKRRYYFADRISSAENARLLKVYRELIHTKPGDAVVLYAVTDPLVGETYLLPNFAKLDSDVKQSHVLFHEAMWVLSSINTYHSDSHWAPDPIPYVTYENVVNAERAFGSYLDMRAAGHDDYPIDLYRRLSDVMFSPSILLVSALDYDLRKRSIEAKQLAVSETESPRQSELGQLPNDFTVIQENKLFGLQGEPGWYRVTLGGDQLRAWALEQSIVHPEQALYKALSIQPSACITNEKVNADRDAWLLDNLRPKDHYFIYDPEQRSVLTSGNEGFREKTRRLYGRS